MRLRSVFICQVLLPCLPLLMNIVVVKSLRAVRRTPNRRFIGMFQSASTTKTTTTPVLPPVATTSKRIFWVRHGEVINPGGPGRSVYYGAQDVLLSPLGELEAQVAAEYLSQFPLAQVFSSPLKRAIFGAEQVLKFQKERAGGVTVLSGYSELDRGAWCGLTKDEIGDENLARFDACDETVTPDGGESYPALRERVLQARDQALMLLQPGEIGCVVSHLQVTRCVLSDALGIPTSKMTELKVATASITCIDYCDDTKEDYGPIVHFQSFKPSSALAESKDGAN
jgi:phosphoserine phosphatase